MSQEIITKDLIGTETVMTGRLYHIGSVQQVANKIMHQCKRCSKVYENKPTSCYFKPDGTNKCGGQDFRKRAAKGTMEDQRFIEINLQITLPSGELAFDDNSLFIVDVRGKAATEFDFEFGDTLRIHGTFEYTEAAKQLNRDLDTFFMYLKADHIEKEMEKLVKKVVVVTDEDRASFKKWANEMGDEIIPSLIGSVAPHIHGQMQDDLKEFGLYMIVGAKINKIGIRPDIHAIVVGDPSTGKSQILKALTNLGEGIYTSTEGEALKRTGLVAGMVKNEKLGQWLWEPGVALLTPNIKALDEVDKNKIQGLFDQLVTILDSGTYTLRGMRHRDFDTPGPWLIGMNPKDGKYDPNKAIFKNINMLSLPLLNRMDMIFIFRKFYSKEVADIVMDRIFERAKGAAPMVMSEESVMKYLKVAKEHTAVEITDEAYDLIRKEFHDRNNETLTRDTSIMITERQIEGLLRISIARAKLLLKNEVNASDAKRAIELYKKEFDAAMTDPATGKPDMQLMDGRIAAEMKIKDRALAIAKEAIGKSDEMQHDLLVSEIRRRAYCNDEVAEDLINMFEKDGELIRGSRHNFWRVG